MLRLSTASNLASIRWSRWRVSWRKTILTAWMTLKQRYKSALWASRKFTSRQKYLELLGTEKIGRSKSLEERAIKTRDRTSVPRVATTTGLGTARISPQPLTQHPELEQPVVDLIMRHVLVLIGACCAIEMDIERPIAPKTVTWNVKRRPVRQRVSTMIKTTMVPMDAVPFQLTQGYGIRDGRATKSLSRFSRIHTYRSMVGFPMLVVRQRTGDNTCGFPHAKFPQGIVVNVGVE